MDPEHDPSLVRVMRRVQKIGVLRLWRRPETDEWFVSLDNRTYHQMHTIAPDKLDLWKREFGL